MYRYHLQPKILSKERIDLLIDDPRLEPPPLYTLKIHPSRRTFFRPHSLLAICFNIPTRKRIRSLENFDLLNLSYYQ